MSIERGGNVALNEVSLSECLETSHNISFDRPISTASSLGVMEGLGEIFDRLSNITLCFMNFSNLMQSSLKDAIHYTSTLPVVAQNNVAQTDTLLKHHKGLVGPLVRHERFAKEVKTGCSLDEILDVYARNLREMGCYALIGID